MFPDPVVAQSGTNPLDKIQFSLTAIDDQGLLGNAPSKRSQGYEFCIPPDKRDTVAGIDPSLQFSNSPGRVGCASGQLLAIGDTHQPHWRSILLNLARLPYIERIAPFWGE